MEWMLCAFLEICNIHGCQRLFPLRLVPCILFASFVYSSLLLILIYLPLQFSIPSAYAGSRIRVGLFVS